jgi:hypothetical protein
MPFIAEEIPAFDAIGDARTFALAGRAIFTLESKATAKRFTFKVTKFIPEGQEPETGRTMWFVKLLTGPENTTDYEFIGTIFQRIDGLFYSHSKKSRIGADAPGARAMAWFVGVLNAGKLPDSLAIYHAGSCGRCGRTLTVPSSILSGFGPECIGKL